jgi:hypothetical protein
MNPYILFQQVQDPFQQQPQQGDVPKKRRRNKKQEATPDDNDNNDQQEWTLNDKGELSIKTRNSVYNVAAHANMLIGAYSKSFDTDLQGQDMAITEEIWTGLQAYKYAGSLEAVGNMAIYIACNSEPQAQLARVADILTNLKTASVEWNKTNNYGKSHPHVSTKAKQFFDAANKDGNVVDKLWDFTADKFPKKQRKIPVYQKTLDAMIEKNNRMQEQLNQLLAQQANSSTASSSSTRPSCQ